MIEQGSLADDLIGLLAASPHGLPCGKLARLLRRRKATVLEILRSDSRFKQTGLHRGSRWTLSRDGAEIISPDGREHLREPFPSVPGVEPRSEVVSAVAGAQSVSQAVEARSVVAAARGHPPEGSKKGRSPRRISAAKEVDDAARMLGMPITRSPDLAEAEQAMRTQSRRRQ